MNLDEPERSRDPRRETEPVPSGLTASTEKQDQMQKFGVAWDAEEVAFPPLADPNTKRAIWRARKMFAEIIHDVTVLEGNPFTLPEIQTLLDGVTVGGRKVSDAEQVLNQKNAFLHLFGLVETGAFSLNPKIACDLQRLAAHGEALEEGVFRSGKVSISGATYEPPAGEGLASMLEARFSRMAMEAETLENHFEKGMVAFLHVARSQCFWDGNKRTGRLLMNGVLLAAGQDIITIPAAKQLEFNQTMLRFYETGIGTEMMNFLSKSQIRNKFE